MCRRVRTARHWEVGAWLGGYTGWVIRALPSQHAARARRSPDSEAGPVSPCKGAGVGGLGAGCVSQGTVGGTAPRTTLRARSVLQALPVLGPSECPPTANMARFDLIFYKVNQNGEVSPKYVEKASVSPYFQNGLGKSALGILRFPHLLAFSHKELMGLI